MGTSVAMIDKHYGHVEVSEIGGEIAKKSVGKQSTANSDQIRPEPEPGATSHLQCT